MVPNVICDSTAFVQWFLKFLSSKQNIYLHNLERTITLESMLWAC